MILKILAVVAVLIVVVILWLVTGVTRGARRRDEKLLSRIDPIGRKIDAGEVVTPEEIAALAAQPEMRHLLFSTLRHLGKAGLLPSGYSSSIAQGEAALAYWMMHPNELKDPPETIEWVETVKRTVDGREADFHVYRCKMPAGHWAAGDGWILGLTGPMDAQAEPYAEMPGAFSRIGDIHGKVPPAELVDWYVGMLKQKGRIT